MNFRFVIKVIIRIFFLVIVIGFNFYLLYNEYYFSALFILLIALVSVYELILYLGKIYSDIHKAILSMQYEDYSLNIPANKSELTLYKDLEKLYKKNKTAYLDQQSIQDIYENIINGLDFGVMILRKKETEDPWSIYLMNNYFSDSLQIPKYKNWVYLKDRIENFTNIFEENGFEEFKKSIELSLDYTENQTYSLKTSKVKTYEYTYYIISLDSVQSIIEKKEKQAWYNLMKVISHEMMNTLTPINSLIENMQYLSDKETLNIGDKNDFKESLTTIKKKALHLMDFVENYRQLTNLPSPVKKQVNVKQLLESSIRIMKPLLLKHTIDVQLDALDERLTTNIDIKLIERVLVNLMTNSLYALSSTTNKSIVISASQKNNRTFITITDNGHGIENSIRDKIFIPFFTTRINGGGIGLTLSKNIIEAHGGYLTFRSNKNKTDFIITLINE